MSFFLILGMHRSGTSCFTGALEHCGVFLGAVKRKGKHNKKGYFEKEEVNKIHDQILALNRCSWYQPPNHSIKIHSHHHQQLQNIVSQLKIKMPCGLKDPRTLLILDFWKNMLGSDCQLIGTFRHPMAVAQSLLHRNNIPIEKGVELWEVYNRIMVEEHQKNPFPLIHFDLSNPKSYRSNLLSIAKSFNLKPSKWRLQLFISSNLEHHSFPKEEVPQYCTYLYNYLIEQSNE